MTKSTINVAVICNTQPEQKDSKPVKLLSEFVPNPQSCNLEVLTICCSEFDEQVLTQLTEFNPDLIIHYGLELGLFFPELSKTVEIGDNQVPIMSDNHSINALFYTEKYMYNVHHDCLKKKMDEIDLIKSRPSKLHLAKTEDDLIYLRDRCFKEAFGADTETNFLNPFIKDPEPQLLCYSLAWLSDEEEAWCIPTSDALLKSGKCTFTKETVLKYTEEIFFKSTQPQYWHNFAYDGLVLFELFNGQQPINFAGDTMILLNLYHYASKSAALKENTHLINLPAYKDPIKDWIEEQTKTQVVKKGEKKKHFGFEDVPLNIIAPYAAMDALAVVRLVNFLKKNLTKTIWQFYYMLPHRLIKTANELAYEGYVLSRDRFLYSKLEYEKMILTTYETAIKLIEPYIEDKKTFNIGSSRQVGDILFNEKKLNLPIFHRTPKKQASVDQKALDDLILFHPFIFHLSKLSKLKKLYSTYSHRGYAGALNQGSRHYIRTNHWTLNSQYRQTNRTARLGSTNFTGHDGYKKKGGPILTLPAQGSLVKHYFSPNIVADAENTLFQKILDHLSEEDRKKVYDAENFDVSLEIKPKKETKKSKKEKETDDNTQKTE